MSEDAGLPARFVNPVRLGQGAQGVTWRARDTELDRDVAVKVLALGEVRDWKAFELFERECTVLQSITHPGVPRYLDQIRDEDAGRYYLVMELVTGRSLARDIAGGRRRTVGQLTDLLRQLLEVLGYLHELRPPVVHRDIKPGNVIVDDDGRTSLVDFGAVARPFHKKGGSTMIGSFGYMAPEQLHGQAGPRTDLYALGATVAAVAAGTEAEDLPRRGIVIDLDAILDPGPLRETLRAMLATDPDDRPVSARAALHSLDDPTPHRRLPPAASTAVARAQPTTPAELSPRGKMLFRGGVLGVVLLAVATRSALLLAPAAILVIVITMLQGFKRAQRGDDE